MEIMRCESLSKVYQTGESKVFALDGVTLSLQQGSFTAITGPSGSGKSTLLHLLSGLDHPTSGQVFYQGDDLYRYRDNQLSVLRRRRFGFVFQNYNLVPILNVYENIVLPVQLDGRKADKGFLEEIVHSLGLQDKLQNLPNNLSGGQQQRVSIARALLTKPEIILADEPTGNLDSRTSEDVLELLKITSAKFQQTTIMITHNDAIAQTADRIIRIEDGRVRQ